MTESSARRCWYTAWNGAYLNTAGEGADSVTVEHNGVLSRPEYEELVWQELGKVLQRLSWDELVMCGADTVTAERMRHLFPGWKISLAARAAPFVPLEPVRLAPDGLLGLLSANTRDRWRRRNLPGAFSRPRWVAFHEQLHREAPASSRLFRLRLGDRTVAAMYFLQHAGHVAFYQSGVQHDAALSRAKPGLLLHMKVIECLAAEGGTEYDFLASDETEVRYKRSLATQERRLWWGSVLRPTWRTWLTVRLRGLRRRLRSGLSSRLPEGGSDETLFDGFEESLRLPGGEKLVRPDQRGRSTT